MRTLLIIGLLAIFTAGCSDSTPTKWQGQGKDFVTAATEAADRVYPSFLYPGQKNVTFKYDDGGIQRKGQITVIAIPGYRDWYVTLEQCQYAPADYCDTFESHGQYGDFQALMAPRGDDCWRWDPVPILMGYENCPEMGICDDGRWCSMWGCPIYRWYDPCPANGTPD